MRSWTWSHWQQHLAIVQALNQKFAIQLKTYIIHPLPQADFRLWLRRHQFYHDDMLGLLQIQGSDLQGLDLKDPENVRDWMNQNFLEHRSVSVLLGL